MEFKYFYTRTHTDVLDVENLGNCFIEAFNDNGTRFYLWIRTELGFTKILEAGPFVDDGVIPCKECNLLFNETSYSDSKMNKRIESFLNTPRYHITQAFDKQEEYTEEEKFSKLYNIIKYMEKEDL